MCVALAIVSPNVAPTGYVNDIVLAILKLRESFERVLYVDIDVHHGDGVAEAFECSNSVFTLSLHCLAAGFFPGTGRASEQGSGRGLGYCGNVGLPIGTRDAVFETAFATAFGVVCDGSFGCAIHCHTGTLNRI